MTLSTVLTLLVCAVIGMSSSYEMDCSHFPGGPPVRLPATGTFQTLQSRAYPNSSFGLSTSCSVVLMKPSNWTGLVVSLEKARLSFWQDCRDFIQLNDGPRLCSLTNITYLFEGDASVKVTLSADNRINPPILDGFRLRFKAYNKDVEVPEKTNYTVYCNNIGDTCDHTVDWSSMRSQGTDIPDRTVLSCNPSANFLVARTSFNILESANYPSQQYDVDGECTSYVRAETGYAGIILLVSRVQMDRQGSCQDFLRVNNIEMCRNVANSVHVLGNTDWVPITLFGDGNLYPDLEFRDEYLGFQLLYKAFGCKSDDIASTLQTTVRQSAFVHTIECEEGYNIQGQSSLEVTCDPILNKWDSLVLTCEENQCVRPQSGSKELVINSTKTEIWYSCLGSHELVGESYGTCQTNETWDISAPFCQSTATQVEVKAYEDPSSNLLFYVGAPVVATFLIGLIIIAVLLHRRRRRRLLFSEKYRSSGQILPNPNSASGRTAFGSSSLSDAYPPSYPSIEAMESYYNLGFPPTSFGDGKKKLAVPKLDYDAEPHYDTTPAEPDYDCSTLNPIYTVTSPTDSSLYSNAGGQYNEGYEDQGGHYSELPEREERVYGNVYPEKPVKPGLGEGGCKLQNNPLYQTAKN